MVREMLLYRDRKGAYYCRMEWGNGNRVRGKGRSEILAFSDALLKYQNRLEEAKVCSECKCDVTEIQDLVQELEADRKAGRCSSWSILHRLENALRERPRTYVDDLTMHEALLGLREGKFRRVRCHHFDTTNWIQWPKRSKFPTWDNSKSPYHPGDKCFGPWIAEVK